MLNPRSEQFPLPEATPDTLHDAVMIAWQDNLAAVRDDALPYGGQSLQLYPTESPRDSVLIFPVFGHKSMDDGTFRLLRRTGLRTTELVDLMTTGDGRRLVSSLGDSGIPSATELVPVAEGALSRMQEAIDGASPDRPLGKIARALGRFASN